MDKRRFDEDMTRLPDWDTSERLIMPPEAGPLKERGKSIFIVGNSEYDSNKSIEFQFDGELIISIECQSEGMGMKIALSASETAFILEFAEACRNVLNMYGY